MNSLLPRLESVLIGLVLSVLSIGPAFATNIIIQSSLGDVEIELFDEQTPKTVANFLNYVNSGAFVDSFIHRSVPGFVIQGGGYTWVDDDPVSVPDNPPVVNEPGISNTRGTIAMAKLGGNPHSATSQWFINMADNSSSLDNSNGGYTVFGQVIGDGMDVIDQINSLKVWNAGSPFNELPLIDYPGSGSITSDHLVFADINVAGSAGVPFNAGFKDAWHNPVKLGGQGVFIVVFPALKQIFIGWFSHDLALPDGDVDFVIGAPGQRWYTGFGPYEGDTAILELELTQGGIFDDDTVPVQSTDGTVTLKAISCEEVLLTYAILSADVSGEIRLARVVDDNVPYCKSLAQQEG